MTTTSNLGITLVEQAQAQKEITVNEPLTRIDAILNTGAISRQVSTPPASPAYGDLYIIGNAPTGSWAGRANQLAYFDQLWRFIIPKKGMLMPVNDEDVLYNYDGTNWVTTISSGGSGTVTHVSVIASNGVSGTVDTPTTTPAITIALGNITPGSVTASGNVTGANLSGINTGDQTITLTGDVTGTGTGSFPVKLASAVIPYLGDFISGLTLAVNSADPNNDIDFAPGFCIDSTRTYPLYLSSTLTKRLDAAWGAGNNTGGLFSGVKSALQTYHCFLIRKTSDGSLDAGYDTSVSAANVPSGYTAFRRLGSIRTDGSSNIIKFFQDGDQFTWDVPATDVSVANPGTSAVTRTLTLPTDISVMALISAGVRNNSSTDISVLITALDQTDTVPSNSIFTFRVVQGAVADAVGANFPLQPIRTNTSAQIRTRLSASSTNDSLAIRTLGWIDRRAI